MFPQWIEADSSSLSGLCEKKKKKKKFALLSNAARVFVRACVSVHIEAGLCERVRNHLHCVDLHKKGDERGNETEKKGGSG